MFFRVFEGILHSQKSTLKRKTLLTTFYMCVKILLQKYLYFFIKNIKSVKIFVFLYRNRHNFGFCLFLCVACVGEKVVLRFSLSFGVAHPHTSILYIREKADFRSILYKAVV